MTLADRIAILNHGELQQHGAPLDVYNQPANDFVRGFLCKHIDEIVVTANNLPKGGAHAQDGPTGSFANCINHSVLPR